MFFFLTQGRQCRYLALPGRFESREEALMVYCGCCASAVKTSVSRGM